MDLGRGIYQSLLKFPQEAGLTEEKGSGRRIAAVEGDVADTATLP